jgi:hypothetical protein
VLLCRQELSGSDSRTASPAVFFGLSITVVGAEVAPATCVIFEARLVGHDALEGEIGKSNENVHSIYKQLPKKIANNSLTSKTHRRRPRSHLLERDELCSSHLIPPTSLTSTLLCTNTASMASSSQDNQSDITTARSPSHVLTAPSKSPRDFDLDFNFDDCLEGKAPDWIRDHDVRLHPENRKLLLVNLVRLKENLPEDLRELCECEYPSKREGEVAWLGYIWLAAEGVLDDSKNDLSAEAGLNIGSSYRYKALLAQLLPPEKGAAPPKCTFCKSDCKATGKTSGPIFFQCVSHSQIECNSCGHCIWWRHRGKCSHRRQSAHSFSAELSG